MKRKNTTRNALFTSILSLLLCVSMLVGTTFAWFTDEVKSGNNRIASGTLDIALEKWNGETWVDVNDKSEPIFSYDLWEPGYTQIVHLRVVNKGNLALKWQASIMVDETAMDTSSSANLADVINVYVKSDDKADTPRPYIEDIGARPYEAPDAYAEPNFHKFTLSDFISNLTAMTQGTMEPGQESYLSLVLQMDTEAGNEYQNLSVGNFFDLTILATQYTYEEDSFDDQYDADASFPVVPGNFNITNNEELTLAFASGGKGTVMNSFDEAYAELTEGTEFALNLNGMTLSGTDDSCVIINKGTLSVTGDGTIASNLYGSIENWGNLVIDDLTLNVSGQKYGFHCKDGEVVINNITLTAQRGGLNIQGGKVIINEGCHIEVDGYSNKVGYGIYAQAADAANPVEVIINGGKFVYNQKYTKYSVIYAGPNASVIINDGTFGKGGSGHKSGGWIRTSDSGGTVIIYGGTFEFDPSAFVADGYEAVKGEDGWWTVSAVNAG